uniref:Uncharacterized protein n=1 Tax=Timema poppense TaxID=170557 RepID=A0A7R9DHS8_TIMPO|nr:unnamed protein product [Timema poppensis]
MNEFLSHDEINLYLSGLITVVPVQRKRPRKDEEEENFREASYIFCVRIVESVQEIPVCKSAFLSLHGIRKGKLNYLLQSLKREGKVQRDKREKHKTRPHALNDETLSAARGAILVVPVIEFKPNKNKLEKDIAASAAEERKNVLRFELLTLETEHQLHLKNQQGEESELPKDWYQVFRDARRLPSPFEITNVEGNLKSSKDGQSIWTTYTRKSFLFTPGLYRSWTSHEIMQPWSGFERTTIVSTSKLPPKKKRTSLLTEHDLRKGKITLPSVHYEGFLKISSEKYKDLHLKRF